ncbi:lipocalin family protein [Pseudomonas sp. GD03944]|uniref:lipocalin family protein n=1 Tax=Pseudomonas sp. GD03944 TaxID=2975409 RepID=UPI00244A8FCA|nr:lipocalin family protein [Pseudomonas sp. GD03944]MDH1263397.1 lipocalin family protein [Pseudomonas sp. GD03944]
MHKILLVLSTSALLTACASPATNALDPRVVGEWQGIREQSTACQFLAWNSTFRPDGSFEITFFADKERTRKIQTEHGTWSASNGQNTLKTNGVPTADVYDYTVLNENSIRYVSTKQDPSADCKAYYEFVEQRVVR